MKRAMGLGVSTENTTICVFKSNSVVKKWQDEKGYGVRESAQMRTKRNKNRLQ